MAYAYKQLSIEQDAPVFPQCTVKPFTPLTIAALLESLNDFKSFPGFTTPTVNVSGRELRLPSFPPPTVSPLTPMNLAELQNGFAGVPGYATPSNEAPSLTFGGSMDELNLSPPEYLPSFAYDLSTPEHDDIDNFGEKFQLASPPFSLTQKRALRKTAARKATRQSKVRGYKGRPSDTLTSTKQPKYGHLLKLTGADTDNTDNALIYAKPGSRVYTENCLGEKVELCWVFETFTTIYEPAGAAIKVEWDDSVDAEGETDEEAQGGLKPYFF